MCLDVSGALISQQHVRMDDTSLVGTRCIVCRYIEYLHVSTYWIEGHMFTTSKWCISASILLRVVSVSGRVFLGGRFMLGSP